MPPIEKYKQGILGDEMHSGRGYPAKIANRKAFLIDFLPLERRCLQRQGFVLDHITYYSNSLSPLIADRKKYGQFIIRRDPGDLSKIYVLDPTGNFYQEVHYSTLYRPTITLWEYRNAIRKLQELGISQVDESKIFDTVEMLRGIVKEAAKKTKSARKDIERTNHAKYHREHLNLLSNKTNEINVNNDFAVDEDSSKNNDDYKGAKQEIRRFQDIEIWKD